MNLKQGSTGLPVQQVQQKLGLKADGYYGPITTKRVRQWQTNNGHITSGEVDDKMWLALFGPPPKVVKPPVTPKPDEQPVIEQVLDTQLTDKLVGHIPMEVIQELPKVMGKFGANNPIRLAHFLAQCSHESGNFKTTVENLNYSAERLQAVFAKYFPGDLEKQYARQPEKIASRVYADRMGNGNEASKDGWSFRGRGYIQLTGRNNYAAFSKFIGEDCENNPDLVSTKYALTSAGYFFEKANVWAACDKGVTDAAIKAVTKLINGGTNGLEDRAKLTKQFYKILA